MDCVRIDVQRALLHLQFVVGVEIGRRRLLFGVRALTGTSAVDLIGAEHNALNPCACKPDRNLYVGVI